MYELKKTAAFLIAVFILLIDSIQIFAGTSLETALNKVDRSLVQKQSMRLIT